MLLIFGMSACSGSDAGNPGEGPLDTEVRQGNADDDAAATSDDDTAGPEPTSEDTVAPSDDDLALAEPEPTAPVDAECGVDNSYEGFAQPFFEQKCNSCHSAQKTGDARLAAPVGVDFDTEDDIVDQAEAIRVRVLVDQTMPIGFVMESCEYQLLEQYLASLDAPACEPVCGPSACGSDGCGGQCGPCADGESCNADSGLCEAAACVPQCQGKACGSDGCDGTCGECGTGRTCSETQSCVCEPQCDGKECGADQCGGVCGNCADGSVCDAAGQCVCIPNCDGKSCGDDGCGGSCGQCPASGWTCIDGVSCECVPDCTNKVCGDDGCGGTCGECAGRICNTREFKCVPRCTPDCTGRVCGDDGCGGSCGDPCVDGETCTLDGQCECEPQCFGKACGDDGCGGTCGQCAAGSLCSADGKCACTPNCDGLSCGSDGCGGSCGECPSGESCSGGACVAFCVPSCDGKECGSDGCGGTCGGCGAGSSCEAGTCAWPDTSFARDVYPIFQKYSCAGNCHGGARPAEELDLSTATIAFDDLVGVASAQCSSRLLVEPGNADGSYLLNKLMGVSLCFGSKMPKAGAGLTQAELDVVRAWIGGGAEP